MRKSHFYENLEVINISFRSARKAAGLTQYETADALGVDQSVVSMWETGKCHPVMKRLTQITELFHCSLDDLLSSDSVASGKSDKTDRKEGRDAKSDMADSADTA